MAQEHLRLASDFLSSKLQEYRNRRPTASKKSKGAVYTDVIRKITSLMKGECILGGSTIVEVLMYKKENPLVGDIDVMIKAIDGLKHKDNPDPPSYNNTLLSMSKLYDVLFKLGIRDREVTTPTFRQHNEYARLDTRPRNKNNIRVNHCCVYHWSYLMVNVLSYYYPLCKKGYCRDIVHYISEFVASPVGLVSPCFYMKGFVNRVAIKVNIVTMYPDDMVGTDATINAFMIDNGKLMIKRDVDATDGELLSDIVNKETVMILPDNHHNFWLRRMKLIRRGIRILSKKEKAKLERDRLSIYDHSCDLQKPMSSVIGKDTRWKPKKDKSRKH